MTDRELLELAVKAAGLPVEFDGDVNSWYPCGRDENGDVVIWWNPLTDDGDALRLAVKLGADIQPKGFGVEVWVFESRVSSGVVEYGDDPYASTRRAIVLAAVEIGRGME